MCISAGTFYASQMAQLAKIPMDLVSKFSLIVYGDRIDAAFKAMGLN
jgi:ATP-dependent Lon protease